MGNLADKNRCHLFQKVLFQKKWRNVPQVYMKVAVKMEVVMGECYQYHSVKGLMTSVHMCLHIPQMLLLLVAAENDSLVL